MIIIVLVQPAGAHPRGEAVTQPGFTLVAIPDTQFYSEEAGLIHYFQEQTQWIADNVAERKIEFVSHLGDLVQSGGNGGDDTEWNRADAAMDTLDGVVPYSTLPGNHDFESVGNKGTGTSSYAQFFGPPRYGGQSEYLGSAPDGENHAHLFTADGVTFLHLALEWRPDAVARAWAQTQIDAHPGIATIVATHEHLQDADTSGNGAGRSAAGQETWDELISTNEQVFMVLNGHYHRGTSNEDGEFHLHSMNIAGKPVLESLSDYQGWSDGGSGYLRLIRFDIPGSRIDIRTFSPSLGVYQQDANSQFTMPLDFTDRFPLGGVSATTLGLRTLTFREGLDGYAGTVDTELRSAEADTAFGGAASISVDDSDGGSASPNHGLIRFEDLFGGAPGQIQNGHDVVHAVLRLNVFNPGSGMRAHRMLVPWDGSATWNSLVGGISPDGIEALSAADSFYGKGSSSVLVPVAGAELDVTTSLRAWQAGEANHGWAVLPFFGGTNGIDFDSSEGITDVPRPTLRVTTTDAVVETRTFRQGENGYVGALDLEVRGSQPDTVTEGETTLTVDASLGGTPTHVLLRFDDIFGANPGAVPATSIVTSATLELEVTDPGSGFHTHTMLGAWDGATTWNTLSGGVAADDEQADIFGMYSAGRVGVVTGVRIGTVRVDVTEAVRAWAGGVANRGIALLPHTGGTDGVGFASSEHPAIATRPRLTVRSHAVACDGDVNGDGVIDVNDISYVLFRLGSPPPSPDGDVNGDGTVDVNDISYVLFRLGDGCL